MRLLLMALLLASCTDHTVKNANEVASGAVINGRPVTSNESELKSSAVFLRSKTGLCSGVLISSDVVLTAAHCLEGVEYDHVLLGRSDLMLQNGETYPANTRRLPYNSKIINKVKIKKSIMHPSYLTRENERNKNHDLALLILDEKVDSTFSPMSIFGNDQFLVEGVPLLVSGFSPYSSPLKGDIFDSLSQPIEKSYNPSNFDRNEFAELLMRNTILISDRPAQRDHTFIFYQPAGGLCSGDSGGPTMVSLDDKLYLVGINRAVFGKDNSTKVDCEHFGVSTLPIRYRSWIDQTIRSEGAEAASYTIPRADLNQKEVRCSKTLIQTDNVYQSLYHNTKKFCRYDSRVMEEDLDKMASQCEEVCSDLRGFSGQCEFYSRGIVKIINHIESTCNK